MAKQSRRGSGLRFTVAVEFLAGIFGLYGIGRLLAGRQKEARIFLLASLVLIILIGFAPKVLVGDEYADWVKWPIQLALAALSALHLNLMLDRAQRHQRKSRGQ